ncbi:hypothetical protein PRVXT_001567 [Proteinivorax tanatarense]|uniref:F5/8 type C domain-containing protein n=1 Tax=Proteinivorax tanatarense TaxID=1260629 RepID=A0AAU7VHF9_9FIRM
MKALTKANIHNRFDIEVRDAKTNKLKIKGQAENIILNRMYSRLVEFESYFDNIVFGRGTGTPEPTRTSLFDRIDRKRATTEEVVRDFPVSSWTKSIRLEADEYVGESITEVGISNLNVSVNTHALIKDAEGNLLTINKTDIDIITIYATVFIELDNTNPEIDFFQRGNNNRLISYLTGDDFSDPRLIIGNIGENTQTGDVGNYIYSRRLTRTSDEQNRKVTFSTRLNTDEGNYDIYEVALSDLCRASLINSTKWQPFRLEEQNIGVGDGETTEFDLKRYDIFDVDIRVDGQKAENITLNNIESGSYREKLPLWKALDLSLNPNNLNIFSSPFNGKPEYAELLPTTVVKVDPSKIVGKTLEFVLEGEYFFSARRAYVYVDGSNDGEEFEQIYSASDGGWDPSTYTYTIEEPYEYLRFRFSGHDSSTSTIHSVRMLNENYKTPTVVFDTPPSEGAAITADYTVPYIPKTEDYVLDVSFEIQFGEG